MSRTKTIAFLAFVTALLAVVVWRSLSTRPNTALYDWFQAQDRSYFKQIAGDCDLFLKAYPVGSVDAAANSLAVGWYNVPLTNASLPESIRTLRPNYILVSTNNLWLWVNCGGQGRLDWGFRWGQIQTNRWILVSEIPYKCERVFYAETR